VFTLTFNYLSKVERLLKPPPEVALAMELNARRRKNQERIKDVR
jgi:hypothetical protein